MDIRPLTGPHRGVVLRHILEEWGDPIVTRGRAIDVRGLPGFAALDGAQPAGAVLYEIRDGECEIVVLYSDLEGRGAGTALIAAVVGEAQRHGCARVWLITMNDNTHAIRFYQRRGFDLKAVHLNAFEVTRRMKREPPCETVYGIDGIPIRHEFEFEIVLPG